MPSKKPVRTGKSADVKAPALTPGAARRAPSTKSTWSAGVIALGLLGVVTVGLLFAAREPSAPPDARVVSAAHQPTPGADAGLAPVATRKAAAPTSAPTESPRQGALSGAVTVTGCLQRDGDGFRLKDTSGADAPKSRSWKSGFIKKSSASLDMVDAGNGVRLSDHVGQRVSVSGTLISREMHVLSLRRVAATCE